MAVTLETLDHIWADGLNAPLAWFDFALLSPGERGDNGLIVARYERVECIATEGAGGSFLLCHPEGHVIYADSEGHATLIAANLTDAMGLVLLAPSAPAGLVGVAPEDMRTRADEMWLEAVDDQPELAEWAGQLRAALGLPGSHGGPIEAFRTALPLNAGLDVRHANSAEMQFQPHGAALPFVVAHAARQLDSLLEHAIRTYSVTDAHVSAFLRFTPSDLLSAVRSCAENAKAKYDLHVPGEIIRKILKADAALLFRSHFDHERRENLPHWAAVAAACLPNDEVAVGIFEMEEAGADWKKVIDALEHARTPLALDWIERVVGQQKSVSRAWGSLAAKSYLDWPRLKQWLEGGRPLSLVALDALHYIAHYRGKMGQSSVVLGEAPATGELTSALQVYAARDPVPRVTDMVAGLQTDIDVICGREPPEKRQ
jgi:hypothetical protein